MLVISKEQALLRFKRLRQDAEEILNFAQQKNRLDLYRAAEIDAAAYDVVIPMLEAAVKAEEPTL